MTTFKHTIAALLLGTMGTVGIAGCEAYDDAAALGEDEIAADEALGELEQAAIGQPDGRDDQVAELVLHDGWWGDWYESWCPNGTYATHYSQRVEAGQGGGDDTALNAVTLWCQKKGGSTKYPVQPHPGMWGDESNQPSCGTDDSGKPRFMIGGMIRVEGKQGGDHWYKPFDNSNDDTAANDVHMKCPTGTAEANREGKWGKWYPMKTCPTGSAVCGLSVRVEASQGKKDDTGMNGMHLYCCKL